MMTREEIRRSPLFEGISYDSYLQMVDCFQMRTKAYQPGEIILNFGEGNPHQVGILEDGTAALLRIDADGNNTILEEMGAGSVFGETVAFSGIGGDSLMVVCEKDCRVEFVDYAHIVKRCERACTHHSMLVQNMLRLISDKTLALGERVEVLSQRSIRDKLMCYFTLQASKNGGSTFLLPFSLSRLAEYISTDRSAMMRELKKIREEGLAEVKNGEITLLL
ncbi:Crp/Fnr family transcriptional regulator [Oscillibacter hominis]|uniref:Crp/Fnr family transcriptional regulator n=1 Tax=Oscillibacter hominis TaxID=2763056 RepID=A0A7G9B1J2_9FIRM|nr:Crp/Fnr family transcriptional regulator [Oscillibacter hominis]QNL43423.1 Crp/Fnr family transcriptional regulator [Oscillibacter hominis]